MTAKRRKSNKKNHSSLVTHHPSLNFTAPWHKASFDRFIHERLPQLLDARTPLVSYAAESTGTYTCRITVVLGMSTGDITLDYTDIPQPDETGVFEVDGQQYVSTPYATDQDLTEAEIKCVGEYLYDYCETRLSEVSNDLSWDDALARAWLPLDRWVKDMVTGRLENINRLNLYDPWMGETATGRSTSSLLERTNWLTRATHLRRLILPERGVFPPRNTGYVCPFETPEGPNVGRIRHISVGAEIRDGRMVIVNDSPGAALGVSASMVPLIEHNEPVRTLMGANMMRQWLPLSDPEPALVQTGAEPDGVDFWQGQNLLTAFIAWDDEVYEDGLVISESCARRIRYPGQAQPGDKLGNRHGAKGVVSRILPDAEMPCLADGTPVELIVSMMSIPSRMHMGQLREAVLGRVARAAGEPVVVPPFQAPDAEDLRKRLAAAGLPENGMETLTVDGKSLERPCTVGWVYWGCTMHIASDKIHACGDSGRCQRLGQWESFMMRHIGAYETIRTLYNTMATEQQDAGSLFERIASGPVEPAGPPTPMFTRLIKRLAAAGIRLEQNDEQLSFRFAQPEGDVLRLARPIPHPWLPDRTIEAIGMVDDSVNGLIEANSRVERMAASNAPESLIEKAAGQLEAHVRRYFDTLLTSADLRFDARVRFSGRTIMAPARITGESALRHDQIGLPEEIAWTMFEPLVIRELGDRDAVQKRAGRAEKVLDEIMVQTWVLTHRAPAMTPTALLAFKPVRVSGNAIYAHPYVCPLMDADFDGDQMAVFLPVTAAAQAEAEAHFTIVAHLRRDPELLIHLLPSKDALWGLADLSRSDKGRREIDRLAGVEVDALEGFVSRHAFLDAMKDVLNRHGAEKTLEMLEALMKRGFEAARRSGASIGPFAGSNLAKPAQPADDDPVAWEAYMEELAARIAAWTDYDDPDAGALMLSFKSGARANMPQMLRTVAAGPALKDVDGNPIAIRHGFAEGLTPREMFACALDGLERIAQMIRRTEEMSARFIEAHATRGHHALARAMRSRHPGVVFARAAAAEETDPLTDTDSQLFVGLPVDP